MILWWCSCWSWRKHFGFEERVVNNPRITAEGYKIGTRGFTNYSYMLTTWYKRIKKERKMMRLANGIVLDKDTTFWRIEILLYVVEVRIQNEDGFGFRWNQGTYLDFKIQRTRTHDLGKYSCQRARKSLDYNARVELINPIAHYRCHTYRGADVDWYIKADDIVLTKIPQFIQSSTTSKRKEPT